MSAEIIEFPTPSAPPSCMRCRTVESAIFAVAIVDDETFAPTRPHDSNPVRLCSRCATYLTDDWNRMLERLLESPL